MAIEESDIITYSYYVIIFLLLIYCLIRISGSRLYSPVFTIIQALIIIDMTDLITIMSHDPICKSLEVEILPPFALKLLSTFKTSLWLSQLGVIVILAVFHFWCAARPLNFHQLTRKRVILVLMIPLTIATVTSLPMLTEYCGFKFYIPGYYWRYDESKPLQGVFDDYNMGFQVVTLGSLIGSDIYLIFKLRSIRSTMAVGKTMVVGEKVSGAVTATMETITNNNSQRTCAKAPNIRKAKKKWLNLSPELRLALAFIYFSAGFLVATASFSLLTNYTSTFFVIIKKLCDVARRTKLMAYVAIVRKR